MKISKKNCQFLMNLFLTHFVSFHHKIISNQIENSSYATKVGNVNSTVLFEQLSGIQIHSKNGFIVDE